MRQQPRPTETLTRLRVCLEAGRPPSPDLLSDAIECLSQYSDAADARSRRDALIRRAALLLPPSPAHRKATLLAREAKILARTWNVLRSREPSLPYCTPRDCLHAAGLLARLPASQRQFYRVLISQAADMSGHGVVSDEAMTIDP